MSNNKIEMNDAQISLAQSWLPSGSWPYAYNTRGIIWFWQTWNKGLPIKGSAKLTHDQVEQLNQLAN